MESWCSPPEAILLPWSLDAARSGTVERLFASRNRDACVRKGRIVRKRSWFGIGSALVEQRGELGAGAHAELSVDPREVPLDGLGAHEQPGRDFLVRRPLRDEVRDRGLGRCEVERGGSAST